MLFDSHNKRDFPPKYTLHALIEMCSIFGTPCCVLRATVMWQLMAAFLFQDENGHHVPAYPEYTNLKRLWAMHPPNVHANAFGDGLTLALIGTSHRVLI